MKFLLIFAALTVLVWASNPVNHGSDEIISNNELSWFQHLLIEFFTPEGSKILEKISRAEEKTVTIKLSDFDFNSKSNFHRHVNDIPIEAVDFQDDEDFDECGDQEFGA